MTPRRLFAAFTFVILLEAAVFQFVYRDLLWLNQPVATLQAEPVDRVGGTVRDALARQHLTRRHLEALAAATVAPALIHEHVRTLERLHELDPDDPQIALRLGDAYRRVGTFDQARRSFTAALEAAQDVAVRAEALLGLARVSRDTGQFADADAHFRASERVRPFGAALRREHFWVLVHVDAERAMLAARQLSDDEAADAAILERWLALATARADATESADVARRGQKAFPGRAQWSRRLGESLLRLDRPRDAAAAFATAAAATDGSEDDRAMRAIALERAGDLSAAHDVWQTVAPSSRRQRADWWASDLRTDLAGDRLPERLDALIAFVQAHPADAGMRAVAVEALAAAQQPARGLTLIGPLMEGPDALRWRRREGEIALAANDPARAREAFGVVARSGRARAEDHWRLLELSAGDTPPAETLARLQALGTAGDPCARRALSLADAADADEVFAWVARATGTGCPMPERLVLRAARWMAAHDADDEATRLLQRASAEPGATDAVALALAERLTARGEAAAADALLTRRMSAASGLAPFDLVAAQAWARAANGRPMEAWQTISPRLDARAIGTDEAVGFAGLALAASDLEAATRLALPGVGSPRDLAARQVLAAVAQQEGRQRASWEWLSPVAERMATPLEARAWLDAVASVEGPAAALSAARNLPDTAVADADVSTRLALWATSLGLDADAEHFTHMVAQRDPARAELLGLERRVAAGQPASVVADLAARGVTALSEPSLRLLLTAALDAQAWPVADEALGAWRTRGMDADWALLKAAELELGRDGRLSRPLAQQLETRVSSGTPPEELVARLAEGDAALGDHDRALARLGWPDVDGSTPLVVRATLADVLAAAARHTEVLQLIERTTSWGPRAEVARARALVALDRRPEARAAIEAMPASARRADDWRLLADVQETSAARLGVLLDAVERFPDVSRLRAALAAVLQQTGQLAGARAAAIHALRLDPRQEQAWRVRLAVPPVSEVDRVAELDEAGRLFADRPAILVDLAEAAMAAGVTEARSAAVVSAWLTLPATSVDVRALHLRTRLAVATGQWDDAIVAIASARVLEPEDLALRHLEAQVHAWSGRHAAASGHFAAYLELAPADGLAWREYGRLLSWMQQDGTSQEAYIRAETLVSGPVVEAERRTKSALSRQAWRTAVTESARWLSLEPDSLDARMDHAVALDRSGAVDTAARLYAALAVVPALPVDLRQAAARYGESHRPGVTAQALTDSADGFGSQRLLAQRLFQVTVSDRLGPGGHTTTFAELGRGTLDSGTRAWTLTQLRTGADVRLAPAWRASGEAALVDLGSGRGGPPGGASAQATVRGSLAFTPADGLHLRAGAERRPFWENGATVEAGMTASGGSAGVEWLPSSGWAVQSTASAHTLSDGNRRHEAAASVAWRTSLGDRDVEVRSSSFLFGYRDASSVYFSPRTLLRTDLEGEVRHWFGRPRVDGATRAFVAAGLGVGVDSRDARYGLGLARVTLPLGGQWALVGEGRWVQASVYRSSRVAVWIQVGSPR